jgi:DNA helicase HerA-like ATPase
MEYLKKDKHWDDDIASVFIFDEAQLTYGDTGLWNTLFKSISDHPSTLQHRIIVFASYGNPTRINAPVTNMYIKELQMVTLVSIDHHDGLEAAGLYLTRSEFEELVNLRKYAFDPTCLDFIFRISSGHVGAMTDVINIISCDDVSVPVIIRIRI